MNLDMIKSVFPGFQMGDFGMFDKITCLKWENAFDDDFESEHTNLTLEMTGPDKYRISMEFWDVESWRFRGNGQISGFYIKDMTVRGYERSSRYEVGDYEEDAMEFYCSDIVIKSLEKIA